MFLNRRLFFNFSHREFFTYFILLAFLTIFLIGLNTIYVFHHHIFIKNGGSVTKSITAALTTITTTSTSTSNTNKDSIIDLSPEPVLTKSYIFFEEKYITMRKQRSNLNSTRSKIYIDLLLNNRKLTQFAVHELNEIVGCGINKNGNCIKWWTNPRNTKALKTYDFSPDYIDNDLTFVAEPGNVTFFVRIRQYNITSERFELEIRGKYLRLDREIVSTPILTNAVNHNDISLEEVLDPELLSWKRNQSFFVNDYIDFKDKGIYKISPGRKTNTTKEIYCGSALKMLVMISSAPKHFEQRRIIRETYGSHHLRGKNVRLVFLFGMVSSKSIQRFINKEANKYDDIIQVDFADSYHNLTLSHLSMYNWIQVICEEYGLPKYVLKADDDFFLNIDLALRVAYQNPNYELIGVAYCGTKPVRNHNRKYYTPRYMYMPDLYVGYLSGVAYIFRTDIIPRILQVSLTTPIIHMDDVYMTGLVARQLNLISMGSKLFTYGRSDLNPCDVKKMVSSHAPGITYMRTHWNELIKSIPSNCSLTSIENLIPIKPFKTKDMIYCVLQ